MSIERDVDPLIYKFLSGTPLSESEAQPYALSKKELDVFKFVHAAVAESPALSRMFEINAHAISKAGEIIEKCCTVRKKGIRVTYTPEEWTDAPHQVKTETVAHIYQLAHMGIPEDATMHLILRLRGGMFHKTSGFLLQSRYSDSLKKPDLETLMKKMTVCDEEAFFSGHKTETWTEIHYLDEVRFHPTCNDDVYSAFVGAEAEKAAAEHLKPPGKTFVGTTNLSRSCHVTVIPSARP